MMATYRISSDTSMTFSEWERLHNIEKQKRRDVRLYYIKQRTCGFISLVLGVIAPFCCDGDATVSVVALLPLGLYLMFTKKKIMDFRGK